MRKIYKYPKAVLVGIAIITIFFTYNLKNVEIDNDTMKFLSEDNPARVAIEESEKIFGAALVMSVAVESKNGTIFTSDNIQLIDELTREFESIDTVESVQSLTNSDYIENIDGAIVVSKLSECFSGSESDVQKLRKRILSWDLYQDLLISNDFSSSQILVKIQSGLGPDEQSNLYKKLKELTDKKKSKNLKFYIAGIPSMVVLLSQNMIEDLTLLIPFVIVVLIFALYLSFKRFSGIILPLITVLISTVWTVGLMGFLHVPLSILGIVIPVLMMAVGSAYGIHVISHYYDDLKTYNGTLTKEVHSEIIYKSLSYVRKPIFLAGLTTVAGFGSLSFGLISPMRNFGIFSSIGIVFALIVALTLIPSLLAFNYKNTVKRVARRKGSFKERKIEKSLSFYFDSFGKRKYLIIFFAIVIVGISLFGTERLVVDNSIIEYFKNTTHIRISDKFLREKFTGTNTFDIQVVGDGAGVDTNLLKAMDNLSIMLKKDYPEIVKVISFTDTVKRINQVMHIEGDDGLDDLSYEDSDYDDDFSSFYTEEDSFEDTDSFSSFYEDEYDNESSTIVDSEINNDYNYSLKGKDVMDLFTGAYARTNDPNISALELINLLKIETNYNGFAYFEIPTIPEKYGHTSTEGLSDLLSQYYAMTGKIDGFVGKNDDPLNPTHIKMTVMMNSTGNIFTRKIVPIIEEYVDNNFPEGYEVEILGTALAQDITTRLITNTALNSILLSLIMVFIILSVAYKSIFAGIYGMIPLAFTVLFNYGLMGIFGIKLDMSTAMVGSLAIGIGIDYTIHFMASYKKYSKLEKSVNVVTKKALMSSGKAIIFNAFSVAAGFTVLLKSNFYPLMYLGLLIAVTMLVASVAAMTIMPAFLNIFKPKFIRK